MVMRPTVLASFVAAAVACAPSQPADRTTTSSRGLRMDGHLSAARDHDARAAELARWPERQQDPAGFDDPASGLWYRAFDTVRHERQLATVHRTAAAQIQSEYQAACADVDSASISISPLQRFGIGGMPTERGVVFVLSREAGPGARLLAEMRCHRAWMMLGESGMEDCPLDLKGIRIKTYGDETGISVEVESTDPRLVPELQRRAARELERASLVRDSRVTH
jgi:hypothetical protein